MNNIITPDLSGYGAQVIEENGRFALTFWPYCTKCQSPFQFDAEEPFAYCSCGTTEWGDPRPASWVAEAQRESERLDFMIEHRAYVVSDPDCCDGYWLNYARQDGTMWTQATEHETPRAAIDAAMGESNA